MAYKEAALLAVLAVLAASGTELEVKKNFSLCVLC